MLKHHHGNVRVLIYSFRQNSTCPACQKYVWTERLDTNVATDVDVTGTKYATKRRGFAPGEDVQRDFGDHDVSFTVQLDGLGTTVSTNAIVLIKARLATVSLECAPVDVLKDGMVLTVRNRLLAPKTDMVGIVLISATVKIHFIVIVSMDQLTNANVLADISIHHFVNQV
ncbi:hypothetical protein AM593_00157, partial [Mytilus galloprovincialis]